ncbi:MAG: HAD-IA family hydrolase [Candidatus Diapherotrites archaeon]
MKVKEMVDVRKILMPTMLKIILTIALTGFFLLSESISLAGNLIEVVFFIAVIYAFSSVLSFFWYNAADRHGIRAIGFDMGGVYFDGDYYTQQLRVKPGMDELIKKLKRKYIVAVMSNQNAIAHKAFSQSFGLGSVFDREIISGELGAKKPSAEYFKKVCGILKVNPKELIFFDDQQENIDGAKKTGIKAFLFTSVDKAKKDLKSMGINA